MIFQFIVRKPAVLALLLLTAGCATTRGVVNLEMGDEETQPQTSIAADATPVYLRDVVDARRFELKPAQPSTPSLKDGAIDDKAITERAIARKRNTFGQAMGDILLPEDQTVMNVVRSNVQRVLEESGYRVVDAAQPDTPTVDIEIRKFWSWATPGFWAIKIEFESELALRGLPDQPADEALIANGYVHQRHQTLTGGAWIQTMQAGMADMRAKLGAELRDSD